MEAPELVSETPFEHDRWPFTIRAFKTSSGYTVQSFLRAMPVSHAYEVDHAAFEAQRSLGTDPLAALVDLARTDLKNAVYRQWVLHWASH